jgi:DNA repair protein SbcD/Mre11
MKILVTADWHIGKRLHNEDLTEDMNLFFEWLLEQIKLNDVKYLLVAGDIFDNNNPSNESTRIYYAFLRKLSALNCKAIITAGNHDSPSFIDVPKDLLSEFDISVFGIFPGVDRLDEIFVPLKNDSGEVVAVVAAIPFLQDRFVRQVGEGEGAREIAEKIKQGMKSLFAQIGAALNVSYPVIPKIGMAHLHAQGAQISEAEREIQIGNQDGISANDLDQFDYLALGHIHTGQTVLKGKIQYASSPISLGFSENRYQHKVVMLEIENNQIKESEIPVIKNRSLYQLKGTMTEVEKYVKLLKNKYKLQMLLDVLIEEDNYDPRINDKLNEIKENLAVKNEIKIINTRIHFKEKTATRFSSTFDTNELNNLNPIDVFKSRINGRSQEEQTKLIELFSAILADTTQE